MVKDYYLRQTGLAMILIWLLISLGLVGSLIAIAIYCYVNRNIALDREEFYRVVISSETDSLLSSCNHTPKPNGWIGL